MAISKAVRQAVYEKYGGRCAYCGRKIAYKDMQVDHETDRIRHGSCDMMLSSEMEVLWEIQKAIDEAWAHGGYLQDIIFPEGKPDPITFLKRTVELLG